MLRKLYLCGLRKHNCQPFCGPEGRFYCSNSMCSLRPAQFSYLCVCVRILGVLKIVCGCRIKPDCRSPAVVSILTDSAARVTVLLRSTTPLHIYKIAGSLPWAPEDTCILITQAVHLKATYDTIYQLG